MADYKVLGERLERCVKADWNKTKAELARRLGISPQQLNHWLSGKERPPKQRAKQLGEIFGCDPLYFREPYFTDGADSNGRASSTARLEYWGRVVAGLPVEVEGQMPEPIEVEDLLLNGNAEGYGVLDVDGDSMEPEIKAGDRVIVRRAAGAAHHIAAKATNWQRHTQMDSCAHGSRWVIFCLNLDCCLIGRRRGAKGARTKIAITGRCGCNGKRITHSRMEEAGNDG